VHNSYKIKYYFYGSKQSVISTVLTKFLLIFEEEHVCNMRLVIIRVIELEISHKYEIRKINIYVKRLHI